MQLHQIWATPSAYTADTGASLPAFSQSPTLDAAVASGDLPPVEDRLPAEPLVVLGVDGPGLYGGTFFNATYDVGLAVALRDETAIVLNKHSFTADPYPNVAKSYETVDDRAAVWEVKLREGLLWSDGTPFTTADLTFWWNDIILNTDITPQLRPQYKGVNLDVIDHTPYVSISVTRRISSPRSVASTPLPAIRAITSSSSMPNTQARRIWQPW